MLKRFLCTAIVMGMLVAITGCGEDTKTAGTTSSTAPKGGPAAGGKTSPVAPPPPPPPGK
jgi:hypothetical protein